MLVRGWSYFGVHGSKRLKTVWRWCRTFPKNKKGQNSESKRQNLNEAVMCSRCLQLRSFLLINCVLLPLYSDKDDIIRSRHSWNTPQPETPCCCCGYLIIPSRSLSEQSLIRPKSHCSLPALISVSLTTRSETARSRSWDQQAGNNASVTAAAPSRSSRVTLTFWAAASASFTITR